MYEEFRKLREQENKPVPVVKARERRRMVKIEEQRIWKKGRETETKR